MNQTTLASEFRKVYLFLKQWCSLSFLLIPTDSSFQTNSGLELLHLVTMIKKFILPKQAYMYYILGLNDSPLYYGLDLSEG